MIWIQSLRILLKRNKGNHKTVIQYNDIIWEMSHHIKNIRSRISPMSNEVQRKTKSEYSDKGLIPSFGS